MEVDVEFNSAAQVPARLCVRGAVLAEERGFGCVWKGESNSRDPMVLLSAMAAVTSSIHLGTAVYHIYGRSPITLGIQAAVLNELSGGRLILGIGTGNPTIAAWHGSTFDRPLRRLREYVHLVRLAYSGERVEDFQGQFYRSSRGFKLAFDPPPYPLRVWIAALGPQMARLAGRISDGLLVNMANPEAAQEVIGWFREGALSAGKDPSALDVVAKVRLSLNSDLEKAKEALRKVITFYALQRGYAELMGRMGWQDVVRRVQEVYSSSGFAAARRQVPDGMIGSIPMYAGRDLDGLLPMIEGFRSVGCTRLVLAYVPSEQEEDALGRELERFLDIAGRYVSVLNRGGS